MSNLKAIRDRLGLTQTALADELGCTQGNIGHYERGQLLRPKRAEKLIALAAKHGLRITLDHVYGRAPLPQEKAKA